MAKETTRKSGSARRSPARKTKPTASAESAQPKTSKAKTGGRLRSGVRTAASETRKATSKGMHRVAELVDHPLVSELIAIGAMAAVAAIADQIDDKRRPTARSVKGAAKAAAAAMAARLLTEITPAGKKTAKG